MKRLHVGFSFFVGWLVVVCLALPAAAANQEASIVLRFDSGKTFLSNASKAKLRQFFHKYETGPRSRVFVVGYTDSIGDKTSNYRLSRNRAKAIQREIISSFGIDASIVMAVGKGEENPVGDNRRASGRASNRRVEIYLANTRVRKPARDYGPGDPNYKKIQTLVDEARILIKQRELGEALRILKKARGLGGDHDTDWHAAYGIAGFYANAPVSEINAHLATALRIDPYNYLAREYLSRITARQNVARGAITRHMGDSPATAIPVSAVVQQHEYLRLFNVTPIAHRKVENLPVDAWECLDENGVSVTYYFDYSRVYGWAFNKPSAAPREGTAPGSTEKPFVPPSALKQSNPTKESKILSVSEDPKKVWGSKIFK